MIVSSVELHPALAVIVLVWPLYLGLIVNVWTAGRRRRLA